MKLSIGDLQRAIAGAGTLSTFANLYQSVFSDCPLDCVSRLDLELPIPDPRLLIRQLDPGLAAVLSGTGRKPEGAIPAGLDITLISAPSAGQNLPQFLAELLAAVQPDLLALNLAPLDLAADLRYAFSLPCAVGLSFTSEIRGIDRRELYSRRTFSPAGLSPQALLQGWLARLPVMPLGRRPAAAELTYVPSQGYVDLNYTEKVHWESEIVSAEQALDGLLDHYRSASVQVVEDISRELMRCAGSRQREKLVDESCYFISRLWEVLEYFHLQGRLPRVLVVSDLAHYSDIVYLTGLLREGITDELYVPASTLPDFGKMVMDGINQPCVPNPDLPAEGVYPLFGRLFTENVEKRLTSELTEDAALDLAVKIAAKTRHHPQVQCGISVRGSIALLEVLRGLALIRGRLTPAELAAAARIAFLPRLKMRSGAEASPVLEDILKEVIFDFSFDEDLSASALRSINKITGGDLMEKLNRMGQLPAERNQPSGVFSPPSIVPETSSQRDILQQLEKMNFLKRGQNGQYRLTQKALQSMLEQLDRKLQANEITPDEYQRQKAQLHAQMQNLNRPQFKMSSRELADTIMELIDAQDRQWNKDISFQTMRTYYHIKENSEGASIGDEKRDYYSLQKLIDDLEKRKILAAGNTASGLLLTGIALDLLLKYFLEDDRTAVSTAALVGHGKTFSLERGQEVRRYSSGDAFRDIALRPTLREIARQKRPLSEIRAADLRVFLKQPRKPQSDIVICMDTSGSMGFHQKLMYARLVAAGLIQAAFRERNRVGLVAFNDSGQISIPLMENDKETLLNCIAGLNARGNTNIGEGIKASSRMLFQAFSGNQKRIILVSDGQPTAISESAFSRLKERREKDLTEESAILETRVAAGKGIRLSVVHIAGEGEANVQFVRKIAEAGKGKVHRISGPGDLKGLVG